MSQLQLKARFLAGPWIQGMTVGDWLGLGSAPPCGQKWAMHRD